MSLNEGSSGRPLPEGIAGDIEFIRRCLNVIDVELTRKIAEEKPAMSDTALLCPVLNAKEALDRLEAKIGGDKEPKRNMEELSEALQDIASLESWLGDFKEPVDGDSSAIYENAKWDGTKFCGREIPTWWGASWRKALITAVFIARRALDSKEGLAAGGANTNEKEKSHENQH